MTSIRNLKNYIKKPISLDVFFNVYYNFPNGTFEELTHKDIAKLMPLIQTFKTSYITRENVLSGEAILVRDKKGVVLAYKNPFIFTNDYEQFLEFRKQNSKISFECFETDNEKSNYDIDVKELTDDDIKELTNYELYKIYKNAKIENNFKLAKKIKQELFFRPETHQEHKHKSLERILKKEERMIEYD